MSVRKTPKPVGVSVSNLLKGVMPQSPVLELASLWEEIIGELLAKETAPQWLKEQKLIVICSSSLWANELTLMTEQIKEQINQRMGAGYIEQIEFRVGSLEQLK